MTACPLCTGTDVAVTVTRDRLPTMQNRVWRDRNAALAARHARFELAVCRACGFGWNRAFDAALLEYDAEYDNAVPSTVMAAYYESIARELGETYDLTSGPVVDIGCGNGTFLKVLARVWPRLTAVGVDPALPGDSVVADGRVRLVCGVFTPDLLAQPPSLFLSRHVLEHMPDPVGFLSELRRALGDASRAPIFVEVPDASWIFRHQAFWDFCYEHTNYFTEGSLSLALARSGFRPVRTRVAFGDQYRWIEGVADGPETILPAGGPAAAAAAIAYASDERAAMERTRGRLRGLRAAGSAVIVWGMATKGVIFTLLADPDSTLVDASVDVNVNKQGCFVPLSGRLIEPPDALARFNGRRVTVVVMNPNYLAEIRERCLQLGVSPSFVDAAGHAL